MDNNSLDFYKKFYEENRIRLLQYESLRKEFNKMSEEILGKDYYNTCSDVYDSDIETCKHIKAKANENWFTKFCVQRGG